MKPDTIGIIGGNGKMGELFSGVFQRKGYEVLIHDVGSGISIEELCRKSDVVIISVPIREVKSVMEQVKKYVSEDTMVTDFTSVKYEPCGIMETMEVSSVVGGHPLFGPSVDLEGQNFIFCPVRKGKYYEWYKGVLEEQGICVLEMDPEEHDRTMAVVQCLTHLSNISLGDTLRRLEFDLSMAEKVASPVYLMRMYNVGRILAQNPGLYADIQVENPFSEEVTRAFKESVDEFYRDIKKKDKISFERKFKGAKSYLGKYLEKSMTMTDKMIRCLKK